jgi:hypothetical protein
MKPIGLIRLAKGLVWVMVLAATAACTMMPAAPRDLLDDRTGITVSVVGAPIEFEHELTGVSTHDLLTLIATQRDEDGKYSTVILLYRWSVFFGAAPFTTEAGAGELQIDVDGHSIDLQPLPRLPPGLPRAKDLFVPDTTEGAMRAYVTDLDTLRLIAASHELTVRLPKESPIGSYTVWHDGRPALAQFVKHLSTP